MAMAAHAAIVISHMYYVFWGIDRVNRAMNFIDNVYTKALLWALLALGAALCRRLLPLRRTRPRGAKTRIVRLLLPTVQMLLGIGLIVLLVADVARGEKSLIFDGEFAKAWALAFCIATESTAILAVAADREARRRASWRSASVPERPAPRRAPAGPRAVAAPTGRSAAARPRTALASPDARPTPAREGADRAPNAAPRPRPRPRPPVDREAERREQRRRERMKGYL